ncbi:MAG: amino acid ABC transporter substrate-binding protein [Deltaproteobacteria bacterium]|nr:amino acid ABC transporter substrate-binding protein [Deltaproteobacteria bacterium]
MNREGKYVGFAIWVMFFALLAATPPAAYCKDKIVIGQAVSLSGPLATSNAVVSSPYYDLWVKDVNADGGIYVKELGKKLPVELLLYDDKSDIGTMTRLVEKLILEDKVDFILPPWGTANLFAAAPIANKYGYILIGGAGGAEKLKDLRLPYFFQSLNFSEAQVPVLADILVELGVKRVAMINHEDLHGVEYSGSAAPEFAKRGMDVVMKKSYPMGVKDLSSLLKQSQSLKVDAFIGFSYPDECMLITGQAIELGINFRVFALSVGPAFLFYKNAFGQETVEGVIGGGAWNAKSSPGAKAFAEHFQEVTGEPMGNYWGSIYFYSAMQHFRQAVEKAGTLDQKKIRDVMAKEKFETALGPFWYDKRQISANHPGEIGQWQNGIFEVIDPGKKRTASPIVKPDWPKK